MRANIPSAVRASILREARGRCACDPTRHLDAGSAGVGELEIHHIVPWRIVRHHEPINLIALCPSCHVRADRGVITAWMLTQLKRVSICRQNDGYREERAIRKLLKEYLSKCSHVLGEGYQSAAAFVDFAQRRAMPLVGQLKFLDDTGYCRRDPALILALLYLELDLTSQAISLLRLCRDRTKEATEYLRMMGNCWSRAGKHTLGHRWFRRSASSGDRSLALRCNWGDCMIYIGEAAATEDRRREWFRLALKTLSQVRRVDPAVLFNKGRVLRLLGQNDHAETCFRRATEVGPQYPLPFVELAFLYAHKGLRSDSLSAFDEALRRRPRRLAFLLSAAELAEEWGERARALQYLGIFENEARYFGLQEARSVVQLRKRLRLPTQRIRRLLTRRCTQS